MSQALYRRCGCRDENGKQYAQSCPKLDSDPKHGSWAYYYSNGSDPRTKKRRQYSKAGFVTRKAADTALTELKHPARPRHLRQTHGQDAGRVRPGDHGPASRHWKGFEADHCGHLPALCGAGHRAESAR